MAYWGRGRLQAESCVLKATFILPTPSRGACPYLYFICILFLCTQRHLHPPHSSWWCVSISCAFCVDILFFFPLPIFVHFIFVVFHPTPPLFCFLSPFFCLLSSFFIFRPFSFYAIFILPTPCLRPVRSHRTEIHTVICMLFLHNQKAPPPPVLPVFSLHPTYILRTSIRVLCLPHSCLPLFETKKARKLVTPTFERALNGTTVRQVLHLIADTLIKQVTTPYTLHPTPYSLLHTPYTLHPTLYICVLVCVFTCVLLCFIVVCAFISLLLEGKKRRKMKGGKKKETEGGEKENESAFK